MPLSEHEKYLARKQISLLLTGETGTGKSHTASLIHKASGVRGRFVHLNVAECPETLLEAELFGNVRGAFTGAVSERLGAFRSADGGTLFIDEVGELSPHVQAKLLRVLETGRVKPLGSDDSHEVNVRIILATHSPHKLREDLKMRMRRRIRMPALRERSAEDFGEIVAQFVGAEGATLELDAMVELNAYSWPGNVRELQNAISNAALEAGFCVRANGQPIVITADHVRREIKRCRDAREEDSLLSGDDTQAPPQVVNLVTNITNVIHITGRVPPRILARKAVNASTSHGVDCCPASNLTAFGGSTPPRVFSSDEYHKQSTPPHHTAPPTFPAVVSPGSSELNIARTTSRGGSMNGFAALDEGQRKDFLQASPVLGLCPTTVRDILRIGRGEWAVWFLGESVPQIGNVDDGPELFVAEPSDLDDIDRLRWFIEETGLRPPEGLAVLQVAGWGSVEVTIGADPITDRYNLHYHAWSHPIGGVGVVPPGEDVSLAIERDLLESIVDLEHENDAWTLAIEKG